MFGKSCEIEAKLQDEPNATSVEANTTGKEEAASITSLAESEDIFPIIASISLIFVVAALFAIVKLCFLLSESEDARAKVELQAEELKMANVAIRKEIGCNRLDEDQEALIAEGRFKIEDHVDKKFKLHWRELKFEKSLGSGSFGDCFKGTLHSQDVAIKKMRLGLVDKQGFEAFSKEVVMLARIECEHITAFLGYVLHPVLIIVLEFVNGGDLTSYVKQLNSKSETAEEDEDEDGAWAALSGREAQTGAEGSVAYTVQIGVDVAKALVYLHGHGILHRDIKTDNVLISSAMDAKLADLGESRIAEDRTMTTVSGTAERLTSLHLRPQTHPPPPPPKKQQQQQQHSQVGTNGYLAPELIKGERYNSAADIYSFGVLLNTIASLKFPYANMVGGGSEGAVCTWQQINHLSANHDLRPELPPGGLAQSEKLRKLIAE